MQSSSNNSGANQLESFLSTYSINNHNLYQIPDKTSGVNSTYPVRMLGGGPEDVKWAIRKQLVGDNGVVPGVGLAIAGPEYDSYVNNKRIDEQDASFKTWITKNVDLSSPEKQEYFYNMFPWIRDDRLAEVDRQAELQKMMARLNITGPQSIQDWYFMYALQQGYIQVSDKPLQKLNEITSTATYKSGLFSILSGKLFPDKAKYYGVNYANPSNLTGDGNYLGGDQPISSSINSINQLSANVPGSRQILTPL